MKGCELVNTFLDEYNEYIAPKIAEIDVLLREADFFEPCCVARVLSLLPDEVCEIAQSLQIEKIDTQAFLQIMQAGSSRICGFYARELELNSPQTYTSENIAYIYNLDKTQVENAFQKLKIKEVTAFTMPLVFSQIVI